MKQGTQELARGIANVSGRGFVVLPEHTFMWLVDQLNVHASGQLYRAFDLEIPDDLLGNPIFMAGYDSEKQPLVANA